MKTFKPAMLALICGVLLTLTHQQLSGVILDNQRAWEERLLLEMVGGASLVAVDAPTPDAGWQILEQDQVVGHLKPVTTDEGYNGRIRLLLAYRQGGEVISVRVTDHRETPGIGDGLDLEVSDWILGFNGRTNQGDQRVMQLDGMTGATVTSNAVKAAISKALPGQKEKPQ